MSQNLLPRVEMRKPFLIGFVLLLASALNVMPQTVRNTDYSPDQSLKSNARVNPSTLAMELSIPIGGYAGRAGNGIPVSFNYSSKVWEMKHSGIWESQLLGTVTSVTPLFAKRSAAGWTSSLGTPRIDYSFDAYGPWVSNEQDEGHIYKPAPWLEPVNGYGLYYIRRLNVQMPDGSTHEFRADDAPINCGNTSNGCGSYSFAGTYS